LSELIKKILRGGGDDNDDDGTDSSIILTDNDRERLKKTAAEIYHSSGNISSDMLVYSSDLVNKTPQAPPAPPAPPAPEIPTTSVGAPENLKEDRAGLFDQITKSKVLKKVIPNERKTNITVGKILDENTSVASSSKETLDNINISRPLTLIESMSNKLDQINKAVTGSDDEEIDNSE
jgi:hypothetical protein